MRQHQDLLRVVLVGLVAFALVACSGSQSAPPPVYGGGQAIHSTSEPASPSAPPPEASYEGEASLGADDAPSAAPAPARESTARRSSPRPEPRNRPGLGTTWGETRTSHVRHRSFERASHSPFAALAVYYNDAEGIAAQMAYRGNEGISPYYLRTPNGGITVALEGQDGRVLHGRQANGRTYVVGREGQRYSIVLRNNTGGRFEVVASVDGLDVIDGKPASTVKRGYLLPPHGKLVIDGFRRSDYAVAAFRFGKVKDSYAARTSGDRNVGVIGLAFFGEKGSEWTTDELRRRETANPFPGGYAQPPPADRAH